MSQLFFIADRIDERSYTVTDVKLYHQLCRVLRMQVGETVYLQQEGTLHRVSAKINQITNKHIEMSIQEVISPPECDVRYTGLILALPNKFDKLELIVQKITEIGIHELVCRPSQRSILRDLPQKKQERLELIAREAAEQSRSRRIPKISFTHTFPSNIEGTLICFDYHDHGFVSESPMRYSYPEKNIVLRGIVGPEGGFSTHELHMLPRLPEKQIVLSDQVLRMETAAIVASRWMTQG